jgi:hypothetical protein
MLLFRSEEHVGRWATERGLGAGGILSPDQGWRLARTWFEDRLAPGWRRRTPEEAQEVFRSIGLDGPFWDLAADVS